MQEERRSVDLRHYVNMSGRPPPTKAIPKNPDLWERFKKFVLALAYVLGQNIQVSKVNLVKATLFAYQNRCFMFVTKTLGKAGVVPRDVLLAIDELIDEGKLLKIRTTRMLPKHKLFGDIELIAREVDELIVPSQVQSVIQSVFNELNIPMTFFERTGQDISGVLKSENTRVQERLSLNVFIRRLEREKDREHHVFHKYFSYWDTGKQFALLGIEQFKVHDLLEIPYPRVGRMSQDPVKRNVALIMDLLRKKRTLPSKHFWVSSAKRSFMNSKEDSVGTVCLFAGFLSESLTHDPVSKTYVTCLTESAYNVHSRFEIKLILDADTDTTATYSTTKEDLFSYEYAVLGVMTEYDGQAALRCYGLIAIDELPAAIKNAWNNNTNA